LSGARAVVLAATGPVGQRVARLLARQGAEVRVASRKKDRAAAVCDEIRQRVPGAKLEPVATASADETRSALDGRQLVVAAGAAGIQLLPESVRRQSKDLKVAIDLNAVPPLGIEHVEVNDKAADRGGVICYGAVGVGGTKMKIHKAAVARLFQSNDQVMDAEEVFALAKEI
jgi:saccharopine dehydrogenase-like NADP-dependent oxidoreductase